MARPSLNLDKFLPYRLSFASNLVSEVIADSYRKLFGLTIPEWRLLAVIAETDGVTQLEIGTRTRMDKVTVSRAAIALKARDLVERRPNPGDGRSHLLVLTATGADLYHQIVPKALELEKAIFSGLGKDFERLTGMLDEIADSALKRLAVAETPCQNLS